LREYRESALKVGDEVARLRAEGVSSSDHVSVAHYFSRFDSDWIQRDNLRAALGYSGFGAGGGRIGADEEASGQRFWHHWTFTLTTATPPSEPSSTSPV
jgi:hypothetical protein